MGNRNLRHHEGHMFLEFLEFLEVHEGYLRITPELGLQMMLHIQNLHLLHHLLLLLLKHQS